MQHYGQISGQTNGEVYPVWAGLEYQPVVHDPGRQVRVPGVSVRTDTEDEEETPFLDFVMGLSQYMRMVCAGAAILLTALVAVNM